MEKLPAAGENSAASFNQYLATVFSPVARKIPAAGENSAASTLSRSHCSHFPAVSEVPATVST